MPVPHHTTTPPCRGSTLLSGNTGYRVTAVTDENVPRGINAYHRAFIEHFPNGVVLLLAWCDAGWKPGAPPYQSVTAAMVWHGYLGKPSWQAMRPADRVAITYAMERLGWPVAGCHVRRSVRRYYRPATSPSGSAVL